MNPQAYVQMAQTEAQHWWFVSRRAILSDTIKQMSLPKQARILEIGCGTGGNLSMLAQHGQVSAIEMDAHAIELAQQNTHTIYDIRQGHFPDNNPFGQQQFDLICLFDVLEHIEQDQVTLIAIKSLLAPQGRLLITVPAYQWLWGTHDEFLHHQRRYNKTELQQKITNANLHISKLSYFNTLLFPLAALVRLKNKVLNQQTLSGVDTPPPWLNNSLRFVFGLEKHLLKYSNLPFGVSLLVVMTADD